MSEALKTFAHQGLALNYQKYGRGAETVIALHGYGQSARVYTSLGNYFEPGFTVFAFDLPFHGHGPVHIDKEQVDRGVSPEQLADYMQAFLESHKLDRFTLIGYSIGGRLALCLSELMHKQVNTLHLLAPDGFYTNPWYRLAVGSRIGRLMFRQLPRVYDPILRLIRGGAKLGLVGVSRLNLIERHASTRDKSVQLYNTWVILRLMRPREELMSQILGLKSMSVFVFLGTHDKLIHIDKVLNCSWLGFDGVLVKIYQKGHRLIDEEIISEIKELTRRMYDFKQND